MPQCVKVHYYAQLRDALKASDEEVWLNLPIFEGEILEILAIRHPKLRDVFSSSRIAIHESYVDPAIPLDSFTEIDIISPISGG
jgi:molybdopterin converting factor small subunit